MSTLVERCCQLLMLLLCFAQLGPSFGRECVDAAVILAASQKHDECERKAKEEKRRRRKRGEWRKEQKRAAAMLCKAEKRDLGQIVSGRTGAPVARRFKVHEISLQVDRIASPSLRCSTTKKSSQQAQATWYVWSKARTLQSCGRQRLNPTGRSSNRGETNGRVFVTGTR